MNRLVVAGLTALLLCLALLVPDLAAAALPAVPPPIALRGEEGATWARGEVVVRYGGGTGETVAIADVKASPAAVMAAVLDLPARKRDIAALKTLEVYRKEPTIIGARWEAGMGPYVLSFHVLYEFDIAKGWCVYGLDSSRPNDLQSTAGSYQAYPIEGGTRLVYRAKADPSSPLPDWAKKRVAFSSAVEMVSGMKRRAEAKP